MNGTGVRSHCSQCGAQLRQGRRPGSRCDPCLRKGLQLGLPPSFYDKPKLEEALADSDFGPVFLAIRIEKRWTQRTLGEYLDLEQKVVSEIERGARSMRDVRVVARIATKCAIPARKLGFDSAADAVTVESSAVTRRKDCWVERRDFIQHVAGLALGFGAAGIDVDRLRSLLPQAEPAGFRGVGLSDVAAIEEATAALHKLSSLHGGAYPRAAAIAQLRSTLPLLDSASSNAVRSRLLVAAGNLAMQAGWMSHDVEQHDAARRLWLVGLELARETDDPRGPDLTVSMLMDMAAQAITLGRPDEAARLVQLGHATVGNGAHPVAESTHGFLAHHQARVHAAKSDVEGCERALDAMAERFRVVEPEVTTPWDAAIHSSAREGWLGWDRYDLAVSTRDPQIARKAVPQLRYVIKHFPPGHPRSHTILLTDLAGAHAIAGDADTAVTVGHQAIDAGRGLASQRVLTGFHKLSGVLTPLHDSSGVAELRERLLTTT